MNAGLARRLRVMAILSDAAAARRAARDGATAVQLRMKGAATAAVVAEGRALLGLPVMIVINDDVDAALELGAHAVHLGDDDPGQERAVSAGLVVGRSASDPVTASALVRQGAAYLGVGPVWTTPSKADAGAAIGIDGLRRVCAAVDVPVLAIGGVDASRAAACITAGAAGVAVIRAVPQIAALSAEVEATLAQRAQAGGVPQLRRTT